MGAECYASEYQAREVRSDATSEPDRSFRESQERVDERRSPIRGWSVKTSVEALSFQTK